GPSSAPGIPRGHGTSGCDRPQQSPSDRRPGFKVIPELFAEVLQYARDPDGYILLPDVVERAEAVEQLRLHLAFFTGRPTEMPFTLSSEIAHLRAIVNKCVTFSTVNYTCRHRSVPSTLIPDPDNMTVQGFIPFLEWIIRRTGPSELPGAAFITDNDAPDPDLLSACYRSLLSDPNSVPREFLEALFELVKA
ncbi:hypothetical protein CEUSTIGMA_g13607.t1, partial [Chlamydomonas eustigma]